MGPFDKEIFQGLTPMIFVSTGSHIILIFLIIVVSSRMARTIPMPEPVFTVSLSSFSLPASGSSESPSAGQADGAEATALKEVKTPEEPPPPPKKKPITLPDKASKKPPAEKKDDAPVVDPVVPKESASSLPIAAGSQEASGIPAGTVEGGSGGITAAGMEHFEYAWYRAMVISKLKEHWTKPVLPFKTAEPFQVIVYFIIERDGSVSHINIDTSSGYPPLDRSAVRAVYDSVPLPPLPRQIAQSNLPARFIFELKQE
jgi:protein TonB